MCEIVDQYHQTVELMRSAAEGTRDAHVWISFDYPGAIMCETYTWAGQDVDPASHGCNPDFANKVNLVYAGTLTRGEAATRLAAYKAANNALGIS